MLLADLRMPSMTGSEAVGKYIYVSERPPNNIFIFQFFSQLINHLNPVFSMRPLSSLQRKPDIYMIYDGHSPYASYETSILLHQKLLTRFPIAKYTSIKGEYYKLSNPLYIDAIGEITAITKVPIINAINKIIIGSIAASTLWVVISTSSS